MDVENGKIFKLDMKLTLRSVQIYEQDKKADKANSALRKNQLSLSWSDFSISKASFGWLQEKFSMNWFGWRGSCQQTYLLICPRNIYWLHTEHTAGVQDLGQWLKENIIPGLTEIIFSLIFIMVAWKILY